MYIVELTLHITLLEKTFEFKNKNQDSDSLFKRQSLNLPYLRYLVDWVATICERCDTNAETLHLAVMCLDHFMDKYSIEDAQLHLITLCCLLIAGRNLQPFNV